MFSKNSLILPKLALGSKVVFENEGAKLSIGSMKQGVQAINESCLT